MVTMSDVAREAGVSVMTVSNVLNERLPVGAPTRARVLAAVRGARVRGEPDRPAPAGGQDRHGRAHRAQLPRLLRRGRRPDRAARRGPRAPPRPGTDERQRRSTRWRRVSVARLQLYDGVLLSVAGLDPEQLSRVRTSKPIVLLGERDVPDHFDHVRLANEEGARLATAHMIERGSRRILALGCTLDQTHMMTSDRRLGWESAHRDAGLPVDERYVVPIATYSSDAARSTLLDVIASGLPFDGIFAATDVIALGARRGAGRPRAARARRRPARGVRQPRGVELRPAGDHVRGPEPPGRRAARRRPAAPADGGRRRAGRARRRTGQPGGARVDPRGSVGTTVPPAHHPSAQRPGSVHLSSRGTP